jgi:uncharacterized protein YdeI (YjbR/CyaY-like superfamily)
MKETARSLEFAGRDEWRAWLDGYHAVEREAWLLLRKKRAAGNALSLEEAVEEALCFGWIDGLLRSIDSDTYLLRFSPRRPKSIWSESNKKRAERLIRAGRMTAAGIEKIAEAKANGEWEAATAREDVDAAPADLAQALERSEAGAAFERWLASRKKQYLHWLGSAKRPETRQKRIQTIVETAGSEDRQ